ncbi:hypothetical protein NON08_10875 [Cetobacterium somerae]|uniref:hypothetical protein n=1 Tax=Cetobacterium sp. NK01 TaxID=2993530 RepID=UPI0021172837|nr:hypothetical protein [Cetobacterium sp. NK01]MCQ8213025.1 hypothetical protein [Cetobacterium sp. NK01]
MKKRYIVFILIITALFSFKLLKISKTKKDFIYVVPKIKNFEVLERNIGKYTLSPIDKNILDEKIEQRNFLNGSLFYNVPNGEYILKGQYKNDSDEYTFKKEKNWEKIYLNLEGIKFSKIQEIFLNFLTACLIGFNIFIYINSRERIPKKNTLRIIFFLLIGKMLFSLRIGFQSEYLILVEFITTRILLFMLIFYLLDNILSKRFKKFRIFIWGCLGIVYFYNIVTILILYSPQLYVYLLEESPKFLDGIRLARRIIDLTRIIFIIAIFQFFVQRVKVRKKISFSWIAIGITYFILEFFRELFPKERNLYYFIELMEICYIYWYLVFYIFKIYTENVMRAIRYSIGATLSYISLFYFKTLTEPAMIISTIIILDFYTNIIENIMKYKNEAVDKIYNRLCLVRDVKVFEKILQKEVIKNVSLVDVKAKILFDPEEYKEYIDQKEDGSTVISKENLKLKDYDYAYRVSFNENKYIALIFVKEGDMPLTIEEQNFLIDLSDKISSIVSKVRLDSLYEELI